MCVMRKCEQREVKTGGRRWEISAHNFELIALYWHRATEELSIG